MTRKPNSMVALEDLGRVRLSRYFTMRDMLYSEIANFYGLPNIPDFPDMAIEAGRQLAVNLLDPLVETFGPIDVRSAYRAPNVNQFGNENNLKCSSNAASFASHIWDYRDGDGYLGATASVSIPWFADRYDAGRDWRDLAWWLDDHLDHSGITFFPKRASFNVSWHENKYSSIDSYTNPKGYLRRAGAEAAPTRAERRALYADFPSFRGLIMPH